MILEWDHRDEIFVVTVPEFLGARTHGRTYEEAVAQAKEMIEGWLDVFEKDGKSPPSPRYFDFERRVWTRVEPAVAVVEASG
jgi:predicted RNase H-like HicB family nuclease